MSIPATMRALQQTSLNDPQDLRARQDRDAFLLTATGLRLLPWPLPDHTKQQEQQK